MTKRALLLVLLVGCGPVRAADDRGDPIFTFRATLQGDTLPDPEGQLQAVFGWVSYGGGPWVDCASTESLAICGFPREGEYETRLTVFDVSVEPRFPDGFDINFYDFPKREDLLEYDGSVFAIGGLAIYDDRNFNGVLDPLDPADPEPIDKLVAESTVTNLTTLALFQEGTKVHPIKAGLDLLLTCPRAPIGYSVGTYVVGEGCKIGEDLPIEVTTSDPNEVGRAQCGGAIADLDLRPVDGPERPPETLPDNAVIECQAGNQIDVWIDNGRFCDRYQRRTYALVAPLRVPIGMRWNLRDDPPEYWPCRVR